MKSIPALLLVLLISAARLGTAATTPAATPSPLSCLNGTYVLVEHAKGVIAPDYFYFRPNGTYTFVLDGKRTIGMYEIFISGTNAGLAIATKADDYFYFNYDMVLRDHSLSLTSKDRKTSVIYAPLPKVDPSIRRSDLTGIFLAHDSSGDCVTALTPDHKFRLAARWIDSLNHTYYDLSIAGTWAFTPDGVITYIPKDTGPSQKIESLRDVVVKRDAKGLWIVDPFDNALVAAKPVKTLDLPPPPAGYTKADQPD